MRAPLGVLFLWACLLATPDSFAREWANNRGDRLEATFVRLRGDTAILRAKGKSVRAPVDQLSDADQEWIARYRELAAPREWGESSRSGEIRRLNREGVELTIDGKRVVLPYAQMMVADFDAAVAFHEHLERAIPEQVGPEREAALARAPPEGLIVRDWTDTRGRTMRAGFEGATAEAAIVWRGSKRFEFPLARLSQADRMWIGQRGLDRLTSDLRGGVSATQSIAMQAFVKAMTSGRPMPAFPQPAVEPPAAAVASTDEPTAQDPVEPSTGAPLEMYASSKVSRGPPPWIDDVYELTPNETEASLQAAFGDWMDQGGGAVGGVGSCAHCDGEFVYPVGLTQDPACPFCGSSPGAEGYAAGSDFDTSDESGWRTPWYLRRSGRRLIIFVVVTVLGAGAKFMLSGGE